MRYHWNVSNVISPHHKNKLTITPGLHEKVCIVRPLGGIYNKKTKEKLVEYDTYKWDGKAYYYDWAPLKNQLDYVLANAEIHQVTLDNPSWAFQRGLKLKRKDKIEVYGNAWPPNDAQAWAQYIKSMLRELIKTYGRTRVEQWRFCIGREIGTPGHWRAGEQAFFEHYKNTEKAVRSVLPKAKVGTHFMNASSKNSYGQNFIPWCKQNGARYDFLGISYYPKYQVKNRVDMEYVYQHDIAPLIELPEWNKQAHLEVHEYALIEDMVNHRAIRAPKLHRNVFTLMMAKMIYEKDLHDVFVWSDAPVYQETLKLLKGLEGHAYYSSSKQGEPINENNMIDALFTRHHDVYEITVYSFNPDSAAKDMEPIVLQAAVPAPAGTNYRYRVGRYEDHEIPVTWGSWKTGNTKPSKIQRRSLVTFKENIPSFSYLKYEIIMDQQARP